MDKVHRLQKAKELAEILGVTLPRVYALYRHGEFDEFAVKIGQKQIRFRPDGLQDYIARGGRRESAPDR